MTFSKPHIVHIITGLNQGGAETVLLRLVSALTDMHHTVISLSSAPASSLIQKFQAHKIEVLSLDMNASNPFHLLKISQLVKILRQKNPAIVQTWMYHANLIGGIAARLAGIKPVIWNIRNGSLQEGEEVKNPLKIFDRTHFVVRVTAWLSGIIPDVILSCSQRAVYTHRFWGYNNNFHVIANGINETIFRSDQQARQKVRKEWKITKNIPIVGLVGRFHPQKDIPTFLQACHLLSLEYPECLFLLCGEGQTEENQQLMQRITKFHLKDKMILLGKRHDIPAVLNGLDILCSASSFGEGFPNILAEAMACNIPCVATDIGDSALIVGDQGIVVPSKNPLQMAEACSRILAHEEEFSHVRTRIVQNFTLDKMVQHYKDFYYSLLGQ